MASIKVKFRPSSIPTHPGCIYYQIIHERKIRQLQTSYIVYSSEWSPKRSMVRHTASRERHPLICSMRDSIMSDVRRITKIIKKLEQREIPFTPDDIIDEFHAYCREGTLFNFMEKIIEKLKSKGKIRTSETYTATLNSFRKFRMEKDIMLDSISSETMEDYQAWHNMQGHLPNTASFYLRILRAVYNRAVEIGLTDQQYPFRHVYTGIDKTMKRALPMKTLKKIKAIDLSSDPSMEYARDMFLLSFYLRGMSFVDMAYLRKSDFKNGYIIYRRRKTGQPLSIKWTREMQAILKKYPKGEGEYFLPILPVDPNSSPRLVYRKMASAINYNLKKVAVKVGIDTPFSLYCARHSWASAAKAKGIPLSVISAGMGHESETTTLIYLASIDTSAIDRANSMIIRNL